MSMQKWALQDAKNRFSELVDKVQASGPQIVTKRGEAAAVVMSFEQFQKLQKPKEDLVSFFANSPLKGVELDLSRSRDTGRDVDF